MVFAGKLFLHKPTKVKMTKKVQAIQQPKEQLIQFSKIVLAQAF